LPKLGSLLCALEIQQRRQKFSILSPLQILPEGFVPSNPVFPGPLNPPLDLTARRDLHRQARTLVQRHAHKVPGEDSLVPLQRLLYPASTEIHDTAYVCQSRDGMVMPAWGPDHQIHKNSWDTRSVYYVCHCDAEVFRKFDCVHNGSNGISRYFPDGRLNSPCMDANRPLRKVASNSFSLSCWKGYQ
jgi:hypothetical protein